MGVPARCDGSGARPRSTRTVGATSARWMGRAAATGPRAAMAPPAAINQTRPDAQPVTGRAAVAAGGERDVALVVRGGAGEPLPRRDHPQLGARLQRAQLVEECGLVDGAAVVAGAARGGAAGEDLAVAGQRHEA